MSYVRHLHLCELCLPLLDSNWLVDCNIIMPILPASPTSGAALYTSLNAPNEHPHPSYFILSEAISSESKTASNPVKIALFFWSDF